MYIIIYIYISKYSPDISPRNHYHDSSSNSNKLILTKPKKYNNNPSSNISTNINSINIYNIQKKNKKEHKHPLALYNINKIDANNVISKQGKNLSILSFTSPSMKINNNFTYSDNSQNNTFTLSSTNKKHKHKSKHKIIYIDNSNSLINDNYNEIDNQPEDIDRTLKSNSINNSSNKHKRSNNSNHSTSITINSVNKENFSEYTKMYNKGIMNLKSVNYNQTPTYSNNKLILNSSRNNKISNSNINQNNSNHSSTHYSYDTNEKQYNKTMTSFRKENNNKQSRKLDSNDINTQLKNFQKGSVLRHKVMTLEKNINISNYKKVRSNTEDLIYDDNISYSKDKAHNLKDSSDYFPSLNQANRTDYCNNSSINSNNESINGSLNNYFNRTESDSNEVLVVRKVKSKKDKSKIKVFLNSKGKILKNRTNGLFKDKLKKKLSKISEVCLKGMMNEEDDDSGGEKCIDKKNSNKRKDSQESKDSIKSNHNIIKIDNEEINVNDENNVSSSQEDINIDNEMESKKDDIKVSSKDHIKNITCESNTIDFDDDKKDFNKQQKKIKTPQNNNRQLLTINCQNKKDILNNDYKYEDDKNLKSQKYISNDKNKIKNKIKKLDSSNLLIKTKLKKKNFLDEEDEVEDIANIYKNTNTGINELKRSNKSVTSPKNGKKKSSKSVNEAEDEDTFINKISKKSFNLLEDIKNNIKNNTNLVHSSIRYVITKNKNIKNFEFLDKLQPEKNKCLFQDNFQETIQNKFNKQCNKSIYFICKKISKLINEHEINTIKIKNKNRNKNKNDNLKKAEYKDSLMNKLSDETYKKEQANIIKSFNIEILIKYNFYFLLSNSILFYFSKSYLCNKYFDIYKQLCSNLENNDIHLSKNLSLCHKENNNNKEESHNSHMVRSHKKGKLGTIKSSIKNDHNHSQKYNKIKSNFFIKSNKNMHQILSMLQRDFYLSTYCEETYNYDYEDYHSTENLYKKSKTNVNSDKSSSTCKTYNKKSSSFNRNSTIKKLKIMSNNKKINPFKSKFFTRNIIYSDNINNLDFINKNYNTIDTTSSNSSSLNPNNTYNNYYNQDESISNKTSKLTTLKKKSYSPSYNNKFNSPAYLKESVLFRTYEIKSKIVNNYKSVRDILIFHIKDGNFNEFLELMEKYKVNKNMTDDEGNTLLILAIFVNNRQIIDYLLNKGFDINAPNIYNFNTPLHYAILFRNYQLIDYLLSRGANENLKNKEGYTPWQFLHI